MKNRIKNEMDDFVINGPLTIEELYTLAKQEGFENRELFFSIKNPVHCSSILTVLFIY
jgi:hypothetical protein